MGDLVNKDNLRASMEDFHFKQTLKPILAAKHINDEAKNKTSQKILGGLLRFTKISATTEML